MSILARALLAVALLVAYLVTASALILVLALVAVLMLSEGADGAGLKAVAWATLVGLAVVTPLSLVVVRKRPVPPGIVVDRADAPELWGMVEAASTALRCRAPNDLLLVPGANAYMHESSRLLGLLDGRRRLYIGAGLLVGLTVDQLRFVLTHELGHHARGDSRLLALTYAGWEAIEDAAQRTGVPWGVALRGYHWLYCWVSLDVLRKQEHQADRMAAEMTGTDVAVSALRRMGSLHEAWRRFMRTYADVTVDGVALDGVTAGFKLFVGHAGADSPEGGGEHVSAASAWATHPPLEKRISVIEAMGTSGPGTAADERLADALVPHLDRYGPVFDAQVLRDRAVHTLRAPLHVHAVSVARARAQCRANTLYRAAARAANDSEAGLGEVLDLLAVGRVHDLAAQLKRARISTDANVAFELNEHLTDALTMTAEGAGAAEWSYTPAYGPALTVDGPLDAAAWAQAAIRYTDAVPGVRAKLRERGIDVADGTCHDVRLSEPGGDVIGAMMVRLNGGLYDLVVEAGALNFIPVNVFDTRWWTRSERLSHRLRQAARGELAPEGQLRVPLDDVIEAALWHPIRANAEVLLRDGTRLVIVDAGPGRVAEPRSLTGRGSGREQVAETRAALRRWVDDVSRAAAPAPTPGTSKSAESLTELAAIEEARRGASKASYAKLVAWLVVPPPVAAVVAGLLSRGSEEVYALGVLWAVPALVVLLVSRRGPWQRPGAVERRAARLASASTGLTPIRWGVLGIVTAVLCPPMCLLALILGIRSVAEARMAGKSVALGVAAIVTASVAPVVLFLLL